MNEWLRSAAEKLGFRQKSYHAVFAGSAQQLVLVDLARYSRAFDADVESDTNSLLIMTGRRQMYFRIIKHLKLTPMELEQVYQPALVQAAARLSRQQGDNDE